MASLQAGELSHCLTHKLKAIESAGKHRTFEVFDDGGVLIARTWMSHSWRRTTALSDAMFSNIRKQLGLSRSAELLQLVDCTLSRDDFLELAR